MTMISLYKLMNFRFMDAKKIQKQSYSNKYIVDYHYYKLSMWKKFKRNDIDVARLWTTLKV